MQRPCNVVDYQRQGFEVYVEFGLATEAEFAQLMDMPKNMPTLNAEMVSMTNPLGKTCKYYMFWIAVPSMQFAR